MAGHKIGFWYMTSNDIEWRHKKISLEIRKKTLLNCRKKYDRAMDYDDKKCVGDERKIPRARKKI